jgi:hypothetical protein
MKIRKLYRPVVRPGNQRSNPQPTTELNKDDFPNITDAGSAKRRPSSSVGHESFFSSTFTIPKARKERPTPDLPQSAVRSPPKASTHVRAHSFSTIDDRAPRPSLEQPGTFKVVINRPQPAAVRHQRSSGDLPALPMIEVPIPNYKLGTPQFGKTGTAVMRSSTYEAGSIKDVPRSSKASNTGPGRVMRSPDALRSSSLFRPHSEAFPRPLFDRKSTTEMVGPRSSLPSQTGTRQSIAASAAYIYDYLTKNPDDPSVVRYAPQTTEILAATPSRLIAHITSPSFLDYELLSDFFLTFRSFIQPDELISFLISRLQWAVNRVDDFGRIVRVRTFVALRHWILNYFVDDFVPDEDLRKHFCTLVNNLYDFLRSRSDGGGGDIKIIGELKKCWRRTCTLHWVSNELYGRESPEDPIVPGGSPTAPSSIETAVPAAPPAVHQPTREIKGEQKAISHSAKPSTVKQSEAQSAVQHGAHPSVTSAQHSYPYSTRTGTMTEHGVPISPSSEQSSHVLSCSIPMKPIYRSDRAAEIPLFPHPVPAGAPRLTVTPSPTSPKAPHPLQSHIRAQSFYDPLKAARHSIVLLKGGEEFEMPAIYVVPGSLVRGVLYQPDSPYIKFKSSGSLRIHKANVHVESLENTGSPGGNHTPPSNPGVKKLFGSVRRALGSKQATLANGGHLDPSFPQAAGQLLSPAAQQTEIPSSSQQSRKSSQRQPTQVRIDLLSARVAETFKEAVEAGMEEDRAVERDILAFTKGRGSTDDDTIPRLHDRRFDRSVTIGSRSIVIMDDTNDEMHMMSGALNPPSSLFNGDRGTLALYQDYMADLTRNSRAQKDQHNRHTGISIDGALTGEKETSTSAEAPAVYLPTGFKKGGKEHLEARPVAPPRQWSRQRFRNSLRSSFTATPSLRRYASYHSGVSTPMSKRVVHPQLAADDAHKSSDGDDFVLGKPPIRQLRRKPGGDLKAATKVQDSRPLERPKSTGSISSSKPAVVDSISLATTNPPSVATGTPKATPRRRRKAREGEDGERRSISLIQTHSSQPNLRPSFEAEVAKLAALPDDELDDGGIEAALLKLEGKFEKKSPVTTPNQPTFTPEQVVSPAKSVLSAHSDWLPGEDQHARKVRHHKEHVQTIQAEQLSSQVSPKSPETIQMAGMHRISQSSDIPIPTYPFASQKSLVESEESYSSIPLLERSHSGTSGANPRKLERLVIRESISAKSAKEQQEQESANSSIEHVVKTDSLRRIRLGESVPRSPTMHESFLLDDQEDLTDVSGGMYAPSDTESQGVRSFFDDEAVEDVKPGKIAFAHPLRHPDTPPVLTQTRNKTPPTAQPTTFNQGLPTPGLTPKANLNFQAASPTTPKAHQRAKPSEVTSPAAHLPFILAYDAETLAQQFTIIEKDALDEIDWKELIELRWKQTSPSVKDWVDYLRTQDPHGVDLVIARFNLVVKWINSEIVLTENQDERVQCIVQYIHVASHCRRMRNYATMYQITIALLQADCSRLKKTWEKVPFAAQQTFKELEQFVQPVRNFHNLRIEMETGMSDDGCIPFIGIPSQPLP